MNFTHHIRETKLKVVIFSMAWPTDEDRELFTQFPNLSDDVTLTKWLLKFEPLIRAEKEEEVICIITNRTGIEGETTFAGTTVVFGIVAGEVHRHTAARTCGRQRHCAGHSARPRHRSAAA